MSARVIDATDDSWSSDCVTQDSSEKKKVALDRREVYMDGMDDDDAARACPHCRLDRVELRYLVDCTIRSFRNMYIDGVRKRYDMKTTLTRDDRVFYALGLVVLLMLAMTLCF